MIGSTDPLGNITTYEYNANGQQTQTLSPEGAVTGSEYDEMGRLILSTDPEGNITTYEYDALGRLVQVNYAVGTDIVTSTVNEYNDNGWLIKATAQDGGETVYEYNKNGQILLITDAKGGVTEYVYDVLGRTVSVIDALNGETSYDYDENGNLISVTDAMGGVTSYEYDELNRVISTTDAVANESVSLVKNRSLVSYDENGNVVKVTNVDEDDLVVSEITYEYDLLDRLISYTDAEENTFYFNHDNNGNTIREIDGRGNSTVTRYDGLDRVVKSYDQLGNFTLTEYDADGRMIKYTNAEGAETNYEYDFNGNVKKITDALENETVFTYDSMNRVKTSTDARGALTTYTYTATGQVASVIDPEGGKKTYTYDLLGNLLTETVYPENNTPGNTTTYTYDALSRPLTVTNPLGNMDTFSYDALGRIKTVKDKNYLINNNVTEYFYDANGNLTETVDALGNSSFFDYDAMNRLVKVTLNKIDPRNGVGNVDQFTFYQYDKRGLVTKEINAAENETIYIYDGNGNLVQKTDADGYVTEYSYDPRNLVNAINYDTANISGGKEAQFAYNKNGELIAMMDWNGTVNFSLDLLDRIISVNDQNKEVTSYTYDEAGNQTGITYPDETVANYTYDLLGQLTNLNDGENHNTGYGYDLAGRLTAMTYPNGWEESYEYDKANQLLEQIAIGPGSNNSRDQVTHRYTYDPPGNILTELRTEAGGQGNGSKGKNNFDLTHKYDKLNRLTQTRGQQGQKNNNHDYTYDSLGNLIHEQTDNNKYTDYWYNNLNQQIRKQVDGKDDYSYSFDDRGNLVKGIYKKNPNNPSQDQIMEKYVYDSTNRMVKGSKYLGKSIDFEETHYIYNGLGYLVGNEWIVAKNSQNHYSNGVNPTPTDQVEGVVVYSRHPESIASNQIDPNAKGYTTGGTTGGTKPNLPNQAAVAHEDYVLDYTSSLQNVIMVTERGSDGLTERGSGGLTYRYTHGLQKESVVIYGIENGQGSLLESQQYLTGKRNIIKLYYHHDHLGSTDYLTANKANGNKLGEVVSYAAYDDWGRLIANSVVEMGTRKLDLVEEYTGHTYDRVLDLYYAKARMYDAADRRFMAVDPVRGTVTNPQTIVQYTYCLNNPLVFIDPLGFASKNPVDLLSDETNFTGVSTTTHDGSTYYHIGGVMKALGGEWPYYDVKLKTITLLLTYGTITLTVNYNVSDVPNYSEGVKGCIIYAWGSYIQDFRFNFLNGQLPILYKDGRTYVNLDELRKYFEQIWCGSYDRYDNLPKINDPSSKNQLSEEQKRFIAVIAGEAIGANEKTQKAVAHTIMNRVKEPRDAWSHVKSVTDVLVKSQYDAVGENQYNLAMAYLNDRDGNDARYETLISTVLPIYDGRDKDDFTGGAHYIFNAKLSTKLEASLKASPNRYRKLGPFDGIDDVKFRMYRCLW
jgi:RHS repeat-associated protein